MINFTFQKEISDVPMILPVEMFIVEEETAAPEFVEEINEVIPTMQTETVEEIPNAIEEAPAPDPIVEEVRQARDAYASQFNYDLKKICKDLKEKEKEYGKRVVSLPPKVYLKATG